MSGLVRALTTACIVQSERNLVFEPEYHAFKGLGSEETILFRVVILNPCPSQRRMAMVAFRKGDWIRSGTESLELVS